MKPDRRTLLAGAVIIVAAMALSFREGRRPARAGGACCPLISGLNLSPTNSWAAVESTNANLGRTASEAITNHQR
jgi:hypothetical protein